MLVKSFSFGIPKHRRCWSWLTSLTFEKTDAIKNQYRRLINRRCRHAPIAIPTFTTLVDRRIKAISTDAESHFCTTNYLVIYPKFTTFLERKITNFQFLGKAALLLTFLLAYSWIYLSCWLNALLILLCCVAQNDKFRVLQYDTRLIFALASKLNRLYFIWSTHVIVVLFSLL